jgi:hypothetical protein
VELSRIKRASEGDQLLKINANADVRTFDLAQREGRRQRVQSRMRGLACRLGPASQKG